MTVVLDTSAFLAVLFTEPGGDSVTARLDEAVMSTVNHCEVVTKLVDAGFDEARIDAILTSFDVPLHAHDAAQARVAGLLRRATRATGLSLGDRACLALATALDAPVLTADRAWRNLDAGVAIEVIR